MAAEKTQQDLNEDWAAVPKAVRDKCDAFVVAHLNAIKAKEKLIGVNEAETEAMDIAYDAMEKAGVERVKVEYKDGSKILQRSLKKKIAIKAVKEPKTV